MPAAATDGATTPDKNAKKRARAHKGRFSIQSKSQQYGLIPLKSSDVTRGRHASLHPQRAAQNQSGEGAHVYTFPRRSKLDSDMKANPSSSAEKSNASIASHKPQLTQDSNFSLVIEGSETNTPTSQHPHANSQHNSPALASPTSNNHYYYMMTSPTASQNGRDDVNSLCSSDTDGSSSFDRFYINENFSGRSVDRSPSASSSYTLSESGCDVTEGDEHPIVTGMKEARRPVQEMKIVSKDGTVRGVKNRVKVTIASFVKQVDGKVTKVSLLLSVYFFYTCVYVVCLLNYHMQTCHAVTKLFYP